MSETHTKPERYTTIKHPEFTIEDAEKELDKNKDLWIKYRMGLEMAEIMDEGGVIFFSWRKKSRIRLGRIMELFDKLRNAQGHKEKVIKEPLW